MTTAQSEEKEKRLYYIALTWMYPTHFDRHLFFFFSFFYYFHAIYIEREKASITLFLSLIRLDRQLLVSSFDAEWVRCCSCLFYFSVCFSGWETRVREYYYIYTQHRGLHYALFCPSLFGWTDSYITQNVCAVRLMLSVAASAAIVIIRWWRNKWKKDERVELFNQRLLLRSDEHFPP